MARSVLVIHGAGEPRRRGRKVYWEPMLASALGPEYVVRAPRMPRPNDPQYQTWARRISELISSATRPVLVGHPFGASVLLKYLAEVATKPSFAGLFLVATPLWGPEFPEFALPLDFGFRLRDVAPLFLYHSRDDAEIPFEHLERYLPVGTREFHEELSVRMHEWLREHPPTQ